MADLRQYETWARTRAHRERVDRARAEIERAATVGRIVVSMSWGKDSCAMGDLACRVLGHINMVHLATPYELPGYDDVLTYFAERATVHTVPSPRSLTETIAWLREIGLGYERDDQEAGKRVKRDRGRAWMAAQGYDVQLLGMRAEESKARRSCFRARGLTYRLASGAWVSNPLGWWSVRDVWAYIATNGVPYNRRIYDAETHGQTRERLRNAGWLTTIDAGEGRIAWLRRHFPEQYRMLAAEFPQVRRLA